MPNKPRRENRHRMVRVEDDLWEAAKAAAAEEGTTVSAVMRGALSDLVDEAQPVHPYVRCTRGEQTWCTHKTCQERVAAR